MGMKRVSDLLYSVVDITNQKNDRKESLPHV